jgi:hypothetical protein
VESVPKIWVLNVQPQLDKQVVVLVVGQTESIAPQKLSIRNAPVTQEHLAALLVSVFTRLYLESIIRRYFVQDDVPDLLHLSFGGWLSILSLNFVFQVRLRLVLALLTCIRVVYADCVPL